jgi:hypothetical protein
VFRLEAGARRIGQFRLHEVFASFDWTQLPTHTIYHPADMAALGNAKLPVIVWGNGGCRNTGNRYRWFVTDIASYGYLILAVGRIDPDPAQELAPSAAPPPAALLSCCASARAHASTRTAQLIDGAYWILAENNRAHGGGSLPVSR